MGGYLWFVVAALVVVDVVLVAKWSASKRPGNQFFHPARPTLIPELVLLPLVVSARQSATLTVVLLGLIGFSAFVRHRPTHVNVLPAGLLLACVAVVFRSDAYMTALLFILAAAILVLASGKRESAYASLLAGLSLYLVANIAGWLAGLKSPSSSVRIGGYDSAGGVFDERVFFPFSRAINESSYIGAALIVAVAAMIRVRQRPAWYHWVGVVAGVVVLVASNSRTPLLLAVLLATALLITPRVARNAAPYVVGVALLLPFLLTPLQPVIRWAGGLIESSDYLARGQTLEQITGLGTRDVIWTQSVHFWINHVDSATQQLVGFGYNGHAASGASAYYLSGIGDFLANRTALTMHNSILQTLFDAGFVGAVILFTVTVFAVRRYGRDSDLLPMFAVVVMLALSGVTEVSIAPGLSQTPAFLLLYLVAFIPVAVPRRNESSSPPDQRQRSWPASRSGRYGLPTTWGSSSSPPLKHPTTYKP